MSVERARNYLKQFGADGRIIEFELSSATVDLAAKAAGVDIIVAINKMDKPRRCRSMATATAY